MLDENGHEVVSDVPVAVPLKFRAPSQSDLVRQFVRAELSRQAQESGLETFEEADDFDVGDDYNPSSPYEEVFDPGDSLSPAPTPLPADNRPTPTTESPMGGSPSQTLASGSAPHADRPPLQGGSGGGGGSA